MSRKITHQYAPSHSWTCIGHPDDPHKTLVDEQGALLYEYVNSMPAEGNYWFNTVFSFDLQTASSPVRITQSTEGARHPFVKTTLEYEHPNATLELLAFAHEHAGKRTDIVLWTVRCGEGTASLDTAVRVEGQALGKVFVLPEDTVPSQTIYSVEAHKWPHIPAYSETTSRLTERATDDKPNPVLAFISVPYELSLSPGRHFGPTARLRTPIVTVTDEQPVQGAFIFPVNYQLEGRYDLGWAMQALESERKFWTTYPILAVDWQIPDGGIMDMITACARNILQAREVKDGLPEFQVGPTCYRGLWVTDGHFILEAARYMGHDSAGKQGIDALLKRVKSDGAIMELDFHPKETGISIATLIRQCELDDDWKRVADLWPVIKNAVGYIRTLREASRKGGENAAEYDLMPAAFADGGLGGKRPEYTTALWTLVGLKKAVEAAQKLDYAEDEQDFRAEYNDLLAVLREKAARDTRTLPDGTPYLPVCMPGASSEHIHLPDFEGEVSPYERINPGTATWALAHAIYPGEIFEPDDPIVQNFCKLLDLIDDEEGTPARTGWLPHNALWCYAASFNAHVWLYVGRGDKAVDYLYEFANHATPTRVWREEQSLRSASFEQIVGDMPHNWASAEFIRLARNLLLFERGNNLDLLLGLPAEWAKPSDTIRLDQTPTRFGPVNFELTFDETGNGELSLTFDIQRTQHPQAVILHLPKGFTCIKVEGQEIVQPDRQYKLPFVSEQTVQLIR